MGGHRHAARQADAACARWPCRVRAVADFAANQEGRARAKAEGKVFGRKPKLTTHQNESGSFEIRNERSRFTGNVDHLLLRFWLSQLSN
jgi:hypothetical protein